MIITTPAEYAAMTDAERLTRLNQLEMDNANLRFRLQEVDVPTGISAEARRLMAIGREIAEGRAA